MKYDYQSQKQKKILIQITHVISEGLILILSKTIIKKHISYAGNTRTNFLQWQSIRARYDHWRLALQE